MKLARVLKLPKLELYFRNWKRYVDDTFAYVLPDKVDIK